MTRQRADTLLAERGLARSRAGAAEAIRAGMVRIGEHGPRVEKPGELIALDAELLVTEGPRYVSRGGIKLENALAATAVDAAGRDCIDIGASTGGFTDCLLQHGAARVVALDVARGQLDWGIRNDPRVTVLERCNARDLESSDVPFTPSLAVIDVSFISLTKILPAIARVVAPGGDVLAMVKPQFELGPGRAPGGVVRDRDARREAIRSVAGCAAGLGLGLHGLASSGLPGPKGNRETFLWVRAGERDAAALEPELDRVEP